jgi:hypothetical protein
VGRSPGHLPLETRRELLSDIAADLKRRTPLIGLSDTLNTTPAELSSLEFLQCDSDPYNESYYIREEDLRTRVKGYFAGGSELLPSVISW